MSSLIDYITGLAAATTAGKMPSTKQANAMADWLLKSPLVQVEQSAAGAGGKLSSHGEVIARDFRELVEAYQAAAAEKNGDDILQDALYELSSARTAARDGDQSEAVQDANDFAGAAKLILEAAFGHITQSGELASFARLTAADVAEAVEIQAGTAKEKLRQTEDEVQDGKRDALGRSVTTSENDDTRQRFEKHMETVKNVGGQTIGTGQDIQGHSQRVRDNAVDRLDDASYRIAERAQNDPEYRRAVDTLFAIYHKYLDRSIDRAQEVQSGGQNANIERQIADLIQDPTGRVPVALEKLRTLVERFAGGKSLNDLFQAAAACAADIREDRDVRQWFDENEKFVRRSMDDPGYLRSEERAQRREQLRRRWEELKHQDTDVGRRWAADVQRLQRECEVFEDAVKRDGSLQRLKNAHVALSKHILNAAPTAGKFVTGQASWIWDDLAGVLLPRVFAMLKEIPLPRTEYVDSDVEFVLENLNLESLQLLPGHVKLSHTTDMDIDAPSSGEARRDVSTHTRIQFSGVQLKLRQVSFYYHDKTMTLAKTVTGLLDVFIPSKGVDIDVTLGLLPTESGAKERRKRQGFHHIDSVNVSLDNVEVAIRESNHQVLLSVFKPVFRARLVAALRESIEQYTRLAIEALDGIAWDVHVRARTFADAGVPLGPSYVSGLVSELGHMAQQSSVFADVSTTNVGVVKDVAGSDKAFAVGAGPQLISGDKHGPVATGVGTGQPGTHGKSDKPVAQKVMGEGVPPDVETFTASVARKREAEKKSTGWRTAAYDLPPALSTKL